ncbi:M14 family metallopeptidase [Streptomyces sp. NBC_00162]|uniref:M14 family metallopeptidase n=1 Tax=Streptomyces sp. NBC_00162 TaxID=2903629 RepID=UPI00214BAAD6|nr:M14 family metallopeptidase [Streptomyces sp. NBC_00162]UUU38284.1 M14 family metallopeptidase [Streptomyces sp. NBC_00162]
MTYLNVAEVDAAVRNLATTYPDICEHLTLPKPSVEGRVCRALRLGPRADGTLPTLVLTGGVHAREWGSCEILINLAADLLRARTLGSGLRYGNRTFSALDLRTIMRRINILIVPLVNPDGRHYSQMTDALWRRNRNPARSEGRPECVGVDINRNYDFLFDFGTAFSPKSSIRSHVSADPCDPLQQYQGPAPFSEPETENVRWALDLHRRTRWFVDVHSYSELILHSWGDDDSQSHDPEMNFRNSAHHGMRGIPGDQVYREFIPAGDLDVSLRLAGLMRDALAGVRGKTYTTESAFTLYPTAGSGDDYAYSRRFTDPSKPRTHSFVIEWGKDFQPPWEEMELIVGDVTSALLAVSLEAARDAPWQLATQTRNPDQMDVFAIDSDGRAQSAWWHGEWHDWFQVGTRTFPPNTPVSTQTRNDDQMDVFAVGGDGGVYSAWWHGQWHEWFRVGTRGFPRCTPVSTLTRDPDYMDLFAVGEDGGVYNAWWHGEWHDWARMGPMVLPPQTPIASLARNSDYMDIFAVGTDGGVWSNWWHGEWHDWFQIGTRSTFTPLTPIAVQSRNDDQMDLFATDRNGAVMSAWWHGEWHDWFRIGSIDLPPNAPIATLTRDPDYMDIFAVGKDGRVWSNWWHGEWHDWFPIGTRTFPPGAPIAVQSRNDDQMDLFVVGGDGKVYSSWWNGEWHEWFQVGSRVIG